MINTKNDIPFIAHMIIIRDNLGQGENKKNMMFKDISYNNYRYDSESEYCQNTTAWD
ncbi:MAG: hypothetical protein IJT65_02250 [Eubacterium sp.]|nr:hypothetical protein [Eubacterium sp.]